MEITQFALAYAIITLLSCILCTSSFVAGILAKSIQARPDADQVMDSTSLRTVLTISRVTFYVSSGASGFLLLVGAGAALLWVAGIFR
jgi:hypothetical protein